MCLLCSSVLPCSSSSIDIDARAVCQAAGSLKKLKLSVNYSCTSEALAKIIDHRPLEELDFALYVTAEVSSACLPPGICIVRPIVSSV